MASSPSCRLIVALADNLTDALSMHIYQESERRLQSEAILFRGGALIAAGRRVAWLGAFAAAMLLLSTLTLKRTL